ncbi:MAG TPA: Fe-S cluster assembly protein SufD [Anaerolineae bacterium]
MAIVNLKPSPLVKSGELTRENVEAYSASQNDPDWMLARRLEALQVFRDTPAPQRTDELWRRVDLSQLKLDQLLATLTASAPAPVIQEHPAGVPGWVALVNGASAGSYLDPALAQQGVIFSDLTSALHEHAALLEKYLMTECVKLTDSYFAALHGVFMRGGTVLYVPKGVSIQQPLRSLIRQTADQRTGFNHTLVVLDEGAHATLIEEYGSETGQLQAMVDGVVEIILGKDSQLDYIGLQDWGRNVWNFTNESAHQYEGSTLHWVVGGMGAKLTKTLLKADMLGAKSTALLSGVFFSDTKQHMHIDTQQNHIAPNCKSDLLYKNALRDDSRTVWRGNIRVFPGAQKSDGYQANRNLQLSSRSRADSIPGLEIEADDVRCTHGATVGQIEEEPMFYMATRGVPEVDARRLIVEGFFAPVIDRIPLEETRDRLTEEISKKIG